VRSRLSLRLIFYCMFMIVVKPYVSFFLLALSINFCDVIRFSGFIFCTTKSRVFSIYINIETDHLSQSCVMFEIAVSIVFPAISLLS
jgi:hypothetical protein